jgi:hypothetical protein
MAKGETLDRREFTVQSLLVMLGGVAITISGCESPTQATYTDKTGNVISNHGHSVVITGAQLGAGGAVTLEIQGTASHPHSVSLTAADVVSIREGRQVSKDSSPNPSGSHAHKVTFN